MGKSLEGWGVAILVLGAALFVLPHLGLHPPGPPNLGFYIAAVGAGLWLVGKVMK